ncbi:MAG: group II intron reverse transcriptase domain-containing protein [Candidatus Pacebacteria bacterium]|nr:group II intron reverse transcriptase domain-containing protein [Candidatus Paceibacterota bacterium]
MFTHKYKDIIGMENLLVTWNRFRIGKKSKKDVVLFEAKLSENLAELHKSLIERKYEHGLYSAFNISDPKPRNIHKAMVRDRVLHHLIYKELYWYFDSRFIHDSYSCRKNKGTHRALDRFKVFAGKVSMNHTRTCYVLKCDIKKFFANIDHKILFKILERHIADDEMRWLIGQVVKSFHTSREGVGLPLGNLTSQLLVNIYMHEFDMFVKQDLRVKCYIRYADDFVILSMDKSYLETIIVKISAYLNDVLKLLLHEHKVYIKTFSSGVDFLGWIHFPHHRVLRTTTRRKTFKKIKGYPKPETVNSYRGLLFHGDTYKIRKELNLI